MNLFEPHTHLSRANKHVLIFDGHGSHLTSDFQFIVSNTLLFCFVCLHIHMLQLLDVSIFLPLKYWFRREVHRRLRLGDSHVPKLEFLDNYSKTGPQALTSTNVLSSFRKTGLRQLDTAASSLRGINDSSNRNNENNGENNNDSRDTNGPGDIPRPRRCGIWQEAEASAATSGGQVLMG